jgi:general secretion pathway protein A
MYTSFYHLNERPFNLSTSPNFLYLGKSHKEALSLLTYGVMDKKGFVLLTGEAGTGKTTILQSLLKKLDPAVKYALISNPLLSPDDFLAYTAYKLGLKKQSKSKGFLLIQFEALLKILLGRRQNAFLIIDEAQDLSFRLLEEIRLLSNMEIQGKRLLNIFLIGQPSLNEKLNNDRCRSLLQRINIKYHLEPLDLSETEAYIKGRLKAAGSKDGRLFNKDAIELIYHYAKGIPRNINSLCDNALLLGYSKTKKTITGEMIQECYRDMRPTEALFVEKEEGKTGKASEKIRPKKTGSKVWLTILIICILLLIAGSFTNFGKRQISTIRDFYEVLYDKTFNTSGDTSSISDKEKAGGDTQYQIPKKETIKIENQ